ncbi:MAG: hypothetical protein IK098_06670 [Bacteroidales bacterium]|nr:hypothetical protein [Bacteroidales bacterium]
MRIGIKGLLGAGLLCCLAWNAGAQEKTGEGVPADVYFLMPEFGQGMVWFTNQGPAQGKLNICAEDNSLRFLDNNGQEVVASSIDNVVKVQIDTAVFVREGDAFYRLYPLSDELAVAVRRDLDIQRDAKQGAYGGYSRTSSIQQYSTVYSDGVSYKLEQSTSYPYTVSETCFLYRGGEVVSFNKRNLRKQFPQRKEEIDAYLKGHSLPDALPDIQAFLSRLASGEPL